MHAACRPAASAQAAASVHIPTRPSPLPTLLPAAAAAARSSGWRWRAPSSSRRACCCAMRPPRRSTRARCVRRCCCPLAVPAPPLLPTIASPASSPACAAASPLAVPAVGRRRRRPARFILALLHTLHAFVLRCPCACFPSGRRRKCWARSSAWRAAARACSSRTASPPRRSATKSWCWSRRAGLGGLEQSGSAAAACAEPRLSPLPAGLLRLLTRRCALRPAGLAAPRAAGPRRGGGQPRRAAGGGGAVR